MDYRTSPCKKKEDGAFKLPQQPSWLAHMKQILAGEEMSNLNEYGGPETAERPEIVDT